MTTSLRQAVTDRLDRVENLLRRLADDYYQGARTYHQLPADDSALRIFWRIRLGVLAGTGRQLADALDTTEPDWEALNHLAKQHPIHPQNSDRKPNSGPVQKRGQR